MVEQIEVVLKYVGGGTFIIGIPARDLTAAEVKEHGGMVELCKTGLYERVAPPVEKPMKAKKKKTAKAETKVTKELEEPPAWAPWTNGTVSEEETYPKYPKDGE